MISVVPIQPLPISTSPSHNGTEQTISTELGEIRFFRLGLALTKAQALPFT